MAPIVGYGGFYMEKAVFAFQIDGTPVECKVFGHGHINYTLRVKTDTGAEYVLQLINKYVFKDPVASWRTWAP